MRHERDFLNGHRFDPPRLPDEEPHVEMFSLRTQALAWCVTFLLGALFWIAVVKGIVWAYSA